MYRFVKANKRSNEQYCITCERNGFIGIMSDEIERGLNQVFTLSLNGILSTGDAYVVEAKYFDEYTPSEEEINKYLNYTEKFDKQIHDILEEALCVQKEIQLLPEINIDNMF